MDTVLVRTAQLISMLFILSSCAAPVIMGGMVVTTGVAGENSRGVDTQMEDSWVAMKIRSYFVGSELIQAGNIGVDVYDGKVLLTGEASNQAEIDEAIRLAKSARGISEVRSEIRIQEISATEIAMDTLITSKVKAQLLADKMVNGLNIHVKTTKKVVYMTGGVQTTHARDQAINIARQVDGVQEVVSYIDVGGN